KKPELISNVEPKRAYRAPRISQSELSFVRRPSPASYSFDFSDCCYLAQAWRAVAKGCRYEDPEHKSSSAVSILSKVGELKLRREKQQTRHQPLYEDISSTSPNETRSHAETPL